MSKVKDTLGFRYIKETFFDRHNIHVGEKPDISPCTMYKTYPDKPKAPLPRRWDGGETNIWKIIQSRRSKRQYTSQPLTRTELTLLLWAGHGITAQAGPVYLRTTPSAGAIYPIETYCVISKVLDIEKGIYHFDVKGFQLEQLLKGNYRKEVARIALDQEFCAKAPVIFIWTAVLRRGMCRYGDRAIRYMFMDAGHICQNVLLAATALGLNACPIGAFFDGEMNDLLQLDEEEETCIYMASIGRKPANTLY